MTEHPAPPPHPGHARPGRPGAVRRRRPRAGGWAALALAAALVVPACAAPTGDDSRSATAGLPDTLQSLAASEWVLDPADSSVAVGAGTPVTLTFGADLHLAGTAPCNTYRGAFTVDGTSIEVGELTQTGRACDPPAMEAERAYLDALAEVGTVDARQRDRLVLEGDGGVRLSFTAVDAYTSLLGTWSVVNVATGDALSSTVAGTDPTVTFRSGGDLEAETGCNPLRSSWALEGRALTVEPAVRTMMACADPPGVMDQEAAMAAALEGAHRVDLVGATLTLVDEAGSKVLVARRR